MPTIIGVALVLIAAYQIYRAWRAPKAGDRTHTALPDHWTRDPAPHPDVHQSLELPGDQALRQTAESREGELSRELLAGRIDPATYQERMSELAHTTTETGGLR